MTGQHEPLCQRYLLWWKSHR